MMPFPLLIHNISGIIIITISKITNTTSTITSIGILTTTATVVNDDYDHDDHDNPHDHDDHSCHQARTAAIHPTCRVGAGSPTHPAQSTYKHTNDECDCEDKYKHIETQTRM